MNGCRGTITCTGSKLLLAPLSFAITIAYPWAQGEKREEYGNENKLESGIAAWI